MLIACPSPASEADAELLESAVERAVAEAEESGLRGSDVTPWLLQRVSELSGGVGLRANLGLLRNNARIAGEIAVELQAT